VEVVGVPVARVVDFPAAVRADLLAAVDAGFQKALADFRVHRQAALTDLGAGFQGALADFRGHHQAALTGLAASKAAQGLLLAPDRRNTNHDSTNRRPGRNRHGGGFHAQN